MRLKSLETNWLRNFDRTIPIPEFMWYPLKGCAGKYYHPCNSEMYDADGRPYHRRFGVIVISPTQQGEIARNIAHEWRHHWQWFRGIKFEIPPKDLFTKHDYDEALIRYFTTSRTEMDALRFEYKMAGVHDYWEELLFDHLKDLKPKQVWL